MSDLDDLVAAMVLGDPNETVPTDVVTAMAQAAINSGWQPPWICQHEWQPTGVNGWHICWRCESQKRGTDGR